jgi:cytoskeletal protein RodZ
MNKIIPILKKFKEIFLSILGGLSSVFLIIFFILFRKQKHTKEHDYEKDLKEKKDNTNEKINNSDYSSYNDDGTIKRK